MKILLRLLTTTAIISCAPMAIAQEYPERSITLVAPVAAGSGADISVRTWAPYLEQCLGGRYPIIVQNMPGGGHVVGLAYVASQPADGYTISALQHPNVVLSAVVGRNSGFEVDSFDYLGSFFGSSATLNVRADSDITSLGDLVDRVREGERRTIGISALGSDDHLLMILLQRLADVEFNVVPLGDAGAARNGLLGGHVDINTLNVNLAAADSEAIRTIAVASAEQLPELPGAPTFREQGYDLVFGARHIFGGPKGIPEDVKEKLGACFAEIAVNEDFLASAESRNLLMNVMNAEQAEAFIAAEYERLTALYEESPWE